MPSLFKRAKNTNYDFDNEADRSRLMLRMLERSELKSSGCLLWRAGKSSFGYGVVRVNGRSHQVHRLAYAVFIKTPAPGMLICHSCDTPNCWNVSHLHEGTHLENTHECVTRGRHLSGKTVVTPLIRGGKPSGFVYACRNGHVRTEENTIIQRGGIRRCRICRTAEMKRRGKPITTTPNEQVDARQVTAIIKYDERGFRFLVDGREPTNFYRTKRGCRQGIGNRLRSKDYIIVDESGVTDRRRFDPKPIAMLSPQEEKPQ